MRACCIMAPMILLAVGPRLSKTQICEQNASIARTSGILERNHGLHSKKTEGCTREAKICSMRILCPRLGATEKRIQKSSCEKGNLWKEGSGPSLVKAV